MARLPRLVIPGIPYHVTQRGNRRAQTFFEEADYALYRDLLAKAAEKADAEIWSYCLMPNHVHIIVAPSDEDGLRRTFADAHRRYTGYINARNRWTGHLWQGRFGAVAMDEAHLAAAVRYVAMNPVRARLVDRAEEWRWSSTKAHLAGRDDELVTVAPVLERYGHFAALLGQEYHDEQAWRQLRKSETSGRPIGDEEWLEELEAKTGRVLRPQKRGSKGAGEFGVFSKLAP
jgi:putative transposase